MERSEGAIQNLEFEHGACDILQWRVVVLQIDRGKRVRDLHTDEVVIGGDQIDFEIVQRNKLVELAVAKELNSELGSVGNQQNIEGIRDLHNTQSTHTHIFSTKLINHTHHQLHGFSIALADEHNVERFCVHLFASESRKRDNIVFLSLSWILKRNFKD